METLVNDTATSWQAWPKAAVSEFMITKSARPDALQDVIGAMTRVAFIRGEPIRHDKLVKAGAGGFMSAILPTGKRAIAIKIDNGGDFRPAVSFSPMTGSTSFVLPAMRTRPRRRG